jgi:hypothetical protein
VNLLSAKDLQVKLPPVILHNGFRDHLLLETLCKKVYFPTRSCSKGEVTLVNGLLFYLFDNYSNENDSDLSSSDCATYARLCEKNFCDGIQDYECLVTPTLENIQCLMMGVSELPPHFLKTCLTTLSTGHESTVRRTSGTLLDPRLNRCTPLPKLRLPPRIIRLP